MSKASFVALSMMSAFSMVAQAAEDVSTDKWPDEWAPLKGMGGCAAVNTAAGMGIKCDTDLGANAMIQGMAKGISGKLCDYCAGTCKTAGQDVCAAAPPATTKAPTTTKAATAAPTTKAAGGAATSGAATTGAAATNGAATTGAATNGAAATTGGAATNGAAATTSTATSGSAATGGATTKKASSSAWPTYGGFGMSLVLSISAIVGHAL